MFLSKIWLFLVALAAAVALTVALVLPQPASRALAKEEQQRLVVACTVVDVLLGVDARNRVELAGAFARRDEIVSALEQASGLASIDEARMKAVRDVGESVMKTIEGDRKPTFAMLIDRKGRVVARVGIDSKDFGDVVAGRPLVDDALAGYLRDDVWAHNGTMYFVSAAPVIKRDPPVPYVGAIVLGHAVTSDLSKRLVGSLAVDLGFYLGKDAVVGSRTLTVDQAPMLGVISKATGEDLRADCSASPLLPVTNGKENYTAVVARLPGEVQAKQGYYAVFIKRPEAIGFAGMLGKITKGDISAPSLWILAGGGFVLMLGLGIVFMFLESDRPLKRLTADAVRLAKGETEKLAEDAHAGKYGSIARSVNIHIDKVGRDAKNAKKDLDQLLGPAPEGSLGTIDLLATALPAVRPGGPAPAAAPPPSDFRFNDGGAARSAPPRPPTPPPVRATPPSGVATPPPRPTGSLVATTPPPSPSSSLGDALVDDILGGGNSGPTSSNVPEDPYFKEIYEQFVSTKKDCGEPTSGLTFAKFAEKLVRNREDLIAKTGCKEVKFTVYVKDGKAALKATPVKDEA
ncbi:MAG TPA: MXAN_5187 family protein [Kofleriaceae bacterium]|nr:MXAN_5187 family protein [Kofleriaceae bacterium]